jgi:hypothetical protein
VDLYTAQKQSQWLDYISLDRGNTTSISIYCISFYDALNMIWNSIKNNSEPAIVICDFNVIDSIRDPNAYSNTDISPHYIVIAGTRKKTGVREFYTLDPWNDMGRYWYSESQMKKIMEIDFRHPYWLWNYPSNPEKPSTPNPCYVGIIN